MKQVIAICILLSIISCSSGGTESSASNNESSDSRAGIIGTWVIVNDATQCEDSYVFSSNDTFSLSSLDERIVGTYQFSTNASSAFDLSITVTSDNGQTDCNGGTLNNAGSTFSYTVEFIENSKMTWSQTLPTPFTITLVKQ